MEFKSGDRVAVKDIPLWNGLQGSVKGIKTEYGAKVALVALEPEQKIRGELTIPLTKLCLVEGMLF